MSLRVVSTPLPEMLLYLLCEKKIHLLTWKCALMSVYGPDLKVIQKLCVESPWTHISIDTHLHRYTSPWTHISMDIRIHGYTSLRRSGRSQIPGVCIVKKRGGDYRSYFLILLFGEMSSGCLVTILLLHPLP